VNWGVGKATRLRWSVIEPTAMLDSVLLVCGLDTTLFRRTSQFAKRNYRDEAQPALLVGGEGLIEWLPRSG
jgi:hypothetical protein